MSSHIVEVCVIDDLVKHPNADTLDIATVKGWNCIVKSGQFNKGDKVIYIPIDSVLPEKLADELGVSSYLKNGERLKSVKLRGYISQGLVIRWHPSSEVGTDVAKVLGITKWNPPAPKYQQGNGKPSTNMNPNPNFDKYNDLENVKNYNTVFQPDDIVVITEKIHGTNFRAGMVPANPVTAWDKLKTWFKKNFLRQSGYEFIVGSRNVQLKKSSKTYYDDNIYHKAAKQYDLENILPDGYTIYGELYGEGVQDLQYGLEGKGIRLSFFDLKIDGKYQPFEVLKEFCKDNDLPLVPVLYLGTFNEEDLRDATNGNSIVAYKENATQIREGAVVKMYGEGFDPRFGRKILKSISDAYLLRKDGTEYQ